MCSNKMPTVVKLVVVCKDSLGSFHGCCPCKLTERDCTVGETLECAYVAASFNNPGHRWHNESVVRVAVSVK